MKKILRLNLENGIDTECCHNQFIAMALTEKNNYPWYFERFNDFYIINKALNKMYYKRSAESGFYLNYDEVITPTFYHNKVDIVKFIKQKINDGEYVSVYCSGEGFTKTKHPHEFLVVGYDENGIYFYNYFNNLKKIDFIENDRFIKMYESVCDGNFDIKVKFELVQAYGFPLVTYKVKRNNVRRTDITKIIFTIEKILNDKAEIHISNNLKEITITATKLRLL